jgi:hypothetical protein
MLYVLVARVKSAMQWRGESRVHFAVHRRRGFCGLPCAFEGVARARKLAAFREFLKATQSMGVHFMVRSAGNAFPWKIRALRPGSSSGNMLGP